MNPLRCIHFISTGSIKKITYGAAIDPPLPLYDSLTESVTPKGNTEPRKKHPIQYRTYQLTWIQMQVFQILLCGIHLTHQTMSIINEDNIQKRILKKLQCKNHSHDPIRKCTNLKSRQLTAAYKSRVVMLKFYEYPIHRRVCLLSFMNLLLNIIKFQGNLHLSYGLSIHKKVILTRLLLKGHMEYFICTHRCT